MDLANFLSERSIAYEKNVLISKKAWIETGGICAYWISPNSIEQLTETCRFLWKNNMIFDLVGQMSNLFFHSTYDPQVVVSTAKVNNYHIKEDTVICDCGANVMKLAKDCLAQGYAGFYGLVGLPGTVASAAVNNAGCFGCSISSMLISADVLMPDGHIQTFNKDDFGYEKRSSRFKRREVKGIVLSVKLRLQKADDIEEEFKKSEDAKAYRKKHQEGYKSNLGSVFAVKKQKRNIRNFIALFVARLLNAFHIAKFSYTKKRALLWLYRYRDLNKYISDKNLNTFIWRDEFAEVAFERYKQFMSKIYKDLIIEIEERK